MVGPVTKMMDSPLIEPDCTGNTILSTGSNKTIAQETQNVRINNIKKVKLEGCGCFGIYNNNNNKKHKMGKNFFLERQGEFSSETSVFKMRGKHKVFSKNNFKHEHKN